MTIFRWRKSNCAIALGILFTYLGSESALATEPADYDRTGAYLGANGVYAFHWFAGHSFDRNLGGRGVQVISSSSGGFNVRGGYRLNSWFAAEAEYEWIDGFTNKIAGTNVATLSSHQVTINGKFLYPGLGRLQPYGLLGGGLSIWEATERQGRGSGLASTSWGIAGKVGVGLDAYINPNLLVNMEIDMALSTTQINNNIGGSLNNLFYVPVQLGVQYRF